MKLPIERLGKLIRSEHAAQFVRFSITIGIGLVVDVCISMFLTKSLGVDLPIAAAVSFLIATIANYFMHSYWTFSASNRRFSFPRLLSYSIVCGLALASRFATLKVEQVMDLPWLLDKDLTYLVVAIGVSFMINFVFSKFIIFRFNS